MKVKQCVIRDGSVKNTFKMLHEEFFCQLKAQDIGISDSFRHKLADNLTHEAWLEACEISPCKTMSLRKMYNIIAKTRYYLCMM